ncbi:MAG: hypothetical protein ACR2OI_02605 [Acidimicrobiia bacterium]
MRKATILIAALALALAACGGGDAGCPGIADDGVDLIQDAINELEGLSLTDLSGDPLSSDDYERRSEDLERRGDQAGCTDEEMAKLFADRVDRLTAGDNNPAGEFLLSIMTAASDEGEFSFGG